MYTITNKLGIMNNIIIEENSLQQMFKSNINSYYYKFIVCTIVVIVVDCYVNT